MATAMYVSESPFSNISERGVSCLESSSKTILKCLDNILVNYTDEHTFTIADFGTSDGSMSLSLLNQMIGRIKAKLGKDTEIMLILEDQMRNDFNSLFAVINGSKFRGQKGDSDKEKVDTEGNIFILASGTSMYKRCLPSCSVNFIFSSVALHCLSSLPCTIKNGIAIADGSKEEYKAFGEIAANDWKDFVLCRGNELKSGGKMVLLVPGKDTQERITKYIDGGETTLGLIANQMVMNGEIRKEEFQAMNFCCFKERSEEDFRKIFKEGDRDIIRLGLRLETIVWKSTIYLQGLDSDEANDYRKRKTYGQSVIECVRPWLYYTIYDGLSNTRGSEEKHRLTDLFFNMLKEFVCSAHSHPSASVVYAEIIITKD